MDKANIAFFDIRPEEQKILEKVLGENGLSGQAHFYAQSLKSDNVLEQYKNQVISVFVDSVVDASVMDHFPNLRMIACRSTGYDNVDVVEAAKRNIIVANVPSYGEYTVAEFAFGLILALSRKINMSTKCLREDLPIKAEDLRGFDLFGKTIGIIGTGRIGRHAIRIAKGFGMKVIAYDIHEDSKFANEHDLEYVPFDTLLSTSDVISIHIPYMKETHHLVDARALSKMKESAILINTSRGGIVDTNALVEALAGNRIAGAGLDVLEEEDVVKDELTYLSSDHLAKHDLKTILADHALLNMKNVIVTPHNAYNTDGALLRILDTTVKNIKAWAAGAPVNVVK